MPDAVVLDGDSLALSSVWAVADAPRATESGADDSK